MKIDCILKFWYKRKGSPKNDFCETPIYYAKDYNNSDFETKYELQIVSLDENGLAWEVLNQTVIDPHKPDSWYYISFNVIIYAYSTKDDTIFCTTTKLTI